MPSKDRKRYDRELAEARGRTTALADRYGGREGTLFGRQEAAFDRFGQFDPQLQEYSQFGAGDVTDLQGGYSPEALAAMRGQAIDAVPGRFDAAARNIRLQQLRRGGGGMAPAGGDYSRDFGNLYAAREQSRAGALRGITVEDERLKRENILANRQHALAKRGVGLQAMGLGASINQARSSAIQGAMNPYISGQTALTQTAGQMIRPEDTRPGFWKQLGGAALGAGLGYLTGGLSTGFTNPFKRKPAFDPNYPN
jgi:hypothetical protein